MNTPHIFFFEAFEEEHALLSQLCRKRFSAAFTPATIQETDMAILPAPVISVRTQSIIPQHWARDVKAILSRSAGYDHLLEYKKTTGINIPCGYLPRYCIQAVAEQAMMLWTSLLRKLPRQMENFALFHRDGITGRECNGRNLVVVGVGNIGRQVVTLGQALGMKVVGVDPVEKYPEISYAQPSEALSAADVIVCCMNLNAGNVGYFNRERLETIRRGAVFVNVARGEMSPAGDLLYALEKGILSGVALDVFENEPTLAASLRDGSGLRHGYDDLYRLSARQDVILTPHNAFNTREAVLRKAEQSIEQIVNFLDRGEFIWSLPSAIV